MTVVTRRLPLPGHRLHQLKGTAAAVWRYQTEGRWHDQSLYVLNPAHAWTARGSHSVPSYPLAASSEDDECYTDTFAGGLLSFPVPVGTSNRGLQGKELSIVGRWLWKDLPGAVS